MSSIWPWLTIAGLGALHGLSPANGWLFAAACGVRAQDAGAARQALLPIGLGHAASVAIVALAVAGGMRLDPMLFRHVAGALLVTAAGARLVRGPGRRPAMGTGASHAGIALWSFLMAGTQGAGLMLVPALVPMCLAAGPAREITASGSLALALAAVAVHMAAMLGATGLIAIGICRGAALRFCQMNGAASRAAWTAALLITGTILAIG